MAVGQHAVRVGESIPMQKWSSPQSGQVHYTDAAAGYQMTAGDLQLCSFVSFHLCDRLRI